MKYIFFDIETIYGDTVNNRIVSLGYVKTDEDFNVIVQEDIFINPQEKAQTVNNWKWKRDATKDREGFKAFYHKIKELLEDKDVIVVGHGTKNDVQYLIDECCRFHFEPIDFDYLDTQAFADLLLDEKVSKKLKNLYEYLCPDGQYYQAHRSLNDAYMTMHVFRALCAITRKNNADATERQDMFANSLEAVYGNMASVARRDSNAFSCNFDIPIISFKIQYAYRKGGELQCAWFDLHYDYATDTFFMRHPAKGSPAHRSVLESESYKIAERKGVYKLHQLWNRCRDFPSKQVFCAYGGTPEWFRIKHVFYSATSYEVYARFVADALQFDFRIAVPDSYFNSAVDKRRGHVVSLERILKRMHTVETANKSLLLMAKMKFEYKAKEFPQIREEAYTYCQGDKYLLARRYYELWEDANTVCGNGSRLIRADKEYIPTRQKLDNNFFESKLEIPVLVERSLQNV